MAELGGELDFAVEALDVDAPGQLGREHFDDHLAAEGGLLSDKDATHPSGT
jgi:hypothetical protein